jgi:hypothetical protein
MSKMFSKLTGILSLSTLFFMGNVPAVLAQSRFNDIQGHWAQACIEQLANRQVVSGFQDGTFRPAASVSRAEFAVMIRKAFPTVVPVRDPISFIDIPTDYWAADAIQSAYRNNFLSGYSERIFNPTRKMNRLNTLLALASGLRYSPTLPISQTLTAAFDDAGQIPETAQRGIAGATEKRMVVNYPDVRKLNPNQEVTRAELAAFICQALSGGQIALISPQYVALASSTTAPAPTTPPVSSTPITPAPSTPAPTQPPSVTQKVQIVEKGDVKAEFSYKPIDTAGTGSNLYLQIRRKGKTLLDEAVLVPTRGLVDNPDGSTTRVSEGRFLGLEVRDIDGDREPEVIADIFSTNSGLRCCSYSFIYRYNPEEQEYNLLEQFWANVGYEVKDIEQDGIVEFDSLDSRFTYAFDIAYSDIYYPKRIWQYRQGRMVDVTRQYPQIVRTHTEKLFQEYESRRLNNQELKGILAAYLANKHSLGEEAAGWQTVLEVYNREDREEYFAQLGKLLADFGYDRASRPESR